jgi:hypothetical protein
VIGFEQRIKSVFKLTLPIQLLTTMPGVGLTLGVVIALEIGDVTRFPTAEKLASYAGCTCRVQPSESLPGWARARYTPADRVNGQPDDGGVVGADGLCTRYALLHRNGAGRPRPGEGA